MLYSIYFRYPKIIEIKVRVKSHDIISLLTAQRLNSLPENVVKKSYLYVTASVYCVQYTKITYSIIQRLKMDSFLFITEKIV
jgi:hypothetical protein